jgi:hypothetical protein
VPAAIAPPPAPRVNGSRLIAVVGGRARSSRSRPDRTGSGKREAGSGKRECARGGIAWESGTPGNGERTGKGRRISAASPSPFSCAVRQPAVKLPISCPSAR